MEDDNLYDEFGNYIGPELDESEEESGGGDDSDADQDSNKLGSGNAGSSSDYAYERPDGGPNGRGPRMQR